jgi:predicted  nucleic acid-binding Zn-ribbon protein
MSDFSSRFEICERAIEQLRSELDALQSVMHRHLDDIITAMLLRMDRMDTVLGGIEHANRNMFADLRTQTEAGFARLRTLIDALPESKDDEPPKLD